MKSYVVKQADKLHGITEADQSNYDQLKSKINGMADGDVIRLEWATPRNPKHHRKFFALVNLINRNSEIYRTVDQALVAIKLASGHLDPIVDPRTGEIIQIPRSISYDAMSQEDFEAFYESALDSIVEHILTHLDRDQADEIIKNILGEWNAV